MATSGLSLSDGAAAFDAPFYSASKEFTVRRGTVETLEMTLTLEAVMVTADFSQEIRDNFSRYLLTVSNGVSSLEFGNAGTVSGMEGGESASGPGDGETEQVSGKTGYFAVTGTLTYSLSLTGNDGRVFSQHLIQLLFQPMPNQVRVAAKVQTSGGLFGHTQCADMQPP